jgi:hypothetical protein
MSTVKRYWYLFRIRGSDNLAQICFLISKYLLHLIHEKVQTMVEGLGVLLKILFQILCRNFTSNSLPPPIKTDAALRETFNFVSLATEIAIVGEKKLKKKN